MKKCFYRAVLLLLFIFCGQKGTAQTKDTKRVEFGNITKSGSYTEYLSKDGSLIKVGDSLQIGIPSNFEKYVYITQNDAYLRAEHMNKKVKIKSIDVSGSTKRGYSVYFVFKGLGVPPVFVNYEDALQTKEIKFIGTNDTLNKIDTLNKKSNP